MKKVVIALFVFCLLFSSATARTQYDEETAQKYINVAERNIKILANALALYANDHYMEYPTERIFYNGRYSRGEFAKYIRTAVGKGKVDTSVYFQCPPYKLLDYKRSRKVKSYKLSCPNPGKYGLKALYFSPKEGFVKDDGSPKKKTVVTMTKKQQQEWKTASSSEREAMVEVINELYNAYREKDLNKVMTLQKQAIERAGREMEKKGKYTKEEVMGAYRGTARDLFKAPEFGMEPLNVVGVQFQTKDGRYRAKSFMPIIQTRKVTVGTMKVRLKIRTFEFEKINGKMTIVKMEMR